VKRERKGGVRGSGGGLKQWFGGGLYGRGARSVGGDPHVSEGRKPQKKTLYSIRVPPQQKHLNVNEKKKQINSIGGKGETLSTLLVFQGGEFRTLGTLSRRKTRKMCGQERGGRYKKINQKKAKNGAHSVCLNRQPDGGGGGNKMKKEGRVGLSGFVGYVVLGKVVCGWCLLCCTPSKKQQN